MYGTERNGTSGKSLGNGTEPEPEKNVWNGTERNFSKKFRERNGTGTNVFGVNLGTVPGKSTHGTGPRTFLVSYKLNSPQSKFFTEFMERLKNVVWNGTERNQENMYGTERNGTSQESLGNGTGTRKKCMERNGTELLEKF